METVEALRTVMHVLETRVLNVHLILISILTAQPAKQAFILAQTFVSYALQQLQIVTHAVVYLSALNAKWDFC